MIANNSFLLRRRLVLIVVTVVTANIYTTHGQSYMLAIGQNPHIYFERQIIHNPFGNQSTSSGAVKGAYGVLNEQQDDQNSSIIVIKKVIQGVRVYGIDRECAMVGGLCVHTSDCLEPTTVNGLCPSSTHLGVECCYELPMRPAPCVQHLGTCMERCNKVLMRPGTDCQKGTVCCVLV